MVIHLDSLLTEFNAETIPRILFCLVISPFVFPGSELSQVLHYSVFCFRSRHAELPGPPRSSFRGLSFAIKHSVQRSRVGHLGSLHGQNSHGKQAVQWNEDSAYYRSRRAIVQRINGLHRSDVRTSREQYSQFKSVLVWEEIQQISQVQVCALLKKKMYWFLELQTFSLNHRLVVFNKKL